VVGDLTKTQVVEHGQQQRMSSVKFISVKFITLDMSSSAVTHVHSDDTIR